MAKHRGTSFINSCVKVPVDPYNRQPTPLYERVQETKKKFHSFTDSRCKVDRKSRELVPFGETRSSSTSETLDSLLDFLESIPDYGQVNHLSTEQFKEKVDYLRRKQRLFKKDSVESIENHDKDNSFRARTAENDRYLKMREGANINDLTLSGKKCYFEESRTSSPVVYPCSSFVGLATDQDLLTYRYKNRDKETKTIRNEAIHSDAKNSNVWDDAKSDENVDSDITDNAETRSLPSHSSKQWHPTVPKPFSFTLREEAEKYMTLTELEAAKFEKQENNRRCTSKKRRTREIPLTSKIPLYDRLMAEKEERSRMIREESALNLMSQVRPFKLECDRRAWRFLTRSSPEVRSKMAYSSARFKAKPVPKNLFGIQIYDRMIEDEYYRELTKKVRAAELMKSSSLPPSMARRERAKLANTHLQDASKDTTTADSIVERENCLCITPSPLEKSRSTLSNISSRGNNLAAVFRCQASRERLENQIREHMEERRREQAVKIKQSLLSSRPAWRALRSAARHEHERDLDIRTSLRREEAREQAERHRIQMETMLDRVTQIPALFERHSQNYKSLSKMQSKYSTKNLTRRWKKLKRQNSGSIDSCASYGSTSRPNSGSRTSSSGNLTSQSQSAKSSESRSSEKSVNRFEPTMYKKKGDRGPLKVSIKETAE